MSTNIELPAELREAVRGWRREFHTFAETGWLEFRTASRVATVLRELGCTVRLGTEVVDADARMGVPSEEEISAARKRAVEQGADPDLVDAMGNGFTGVVGILDTGRPGPTFGFRFDMDANDLNESTAAEHVPAANGFASVNPGAMHGCGHDAHTAIGLGLASTLAAHREELSGKFKLIFQPAEEGVRGAHSIVAAGVLDDVDLFVATHVGTGPELGEVACGAVDYFATTKFDAVFTGRAAHAAGEPEEGRNALLAAAVAAVNLHALPRHSGGTSRVNVGTLHAGDGRNVIAPSARIQAETRGSTSAINQDLFARAEAIIAGAAQMHGVEASIDIRGGASSSDPSEELLPLIHEQFRKVPGVTNILRAHRADGSEDATAMMDRVKERGGLASYIVLGTDLAAGHHTARFDIDESVLEIGVLSLSHMAFNAADWYRG
ncbi:amidohydrolase [Sciscionella sediminilitoris]|uniref:amidohydrolase n=1 Tax=Sciscionella sediminilitoris TaxID=1445613 RepID=UPI00068C737C|nr:amidohydrolase [Sciscionella sp. SE31]